MENKSLSSSELSSFSQEDITSRQSFNFNSYSSHDCTSKYFGREAIEQEGYYCQFCDPKKKMKLCKYCYDNCHLKCREINNNNITKNEIKNSYKIPFGVKFYCDCGIIMKHKVKIISNKDYIFCPMIFFDKIFCKDKSFYCEDNKIFLCSFCYFLCHKECNKKIVNINKKVLKKKCECKTGNHTIYNEFIFQINLLEYQKLIQKKFWPIQLINLLFENNIFKNIEILFNEILRNQNPKVIFSKEHPFPNLLENFTYFLNTQFKTYYFHPKIEQLFPFENLVSFIKNLNCKTPEICLVKFRLMFVLLFVHFKKDFKYIKSLNPIDFITPTILERILIKKFYFSSHFYTETIHKKYHFSNNNCGYIRNIILEDFLPFMIKGLNKNLFNIINFQDEIEMGLRLICFVLKRKLFNMKDLEILIKLINDCNQLLFSSIPFNEDTEKIWLGSFSCLSEIFLMIGIDYNDQVIEEYFEKGKFEHNFIHVLSQHGQILYQMILKAHFAVVQHYQIIANDKKRKIKKIKSQDFKKIEEQLKRKRINPNEIPYELPEKGILYNKTLKILQESLRLFSITDNIYYFQIDKITKNDISYYSNQYNNLKIYLDEYKNNFFAEFSLSLNKLLHKFFLYEDIEMTSDSTSLLFRTELSTFFNYMNKNIKKYINQKNNKDDENYNMKYILKLNKKYKYINTFLYNIENKFNYHKLVYKMCLANINKTLLDILIVFSQRKFCSYINFELVEQIIAILGLIITTKSGIEFFITGKNLTRIQKLINRFSYKYYEFTNLKEKIDIYSDETLQIQNYLLEFLRMLSKGLITYQINISGHNFLKKLSKHLFQHLNGFFTFIDKIDSKKESLFSVNEIEYLKIQFYSQFKKIIQIFVLLSIYYKDVRFEKIKNNIIKIFIIQKHNLCEPTKFYNYFFKDEINFDNLNDNDIITTKRKITENYLISEEGRNLLTENTYRKKTETNEIKEDFDKLQIDLIFWFFKLIIIRENYSYINELPQLKPFYDIFDFSSNNKEKSLFKLFESNKLKIKEKIILLKTMSSLFFMEIISKENFKYMNNHVTTKEYLKYFFDKNINAYPSIIKENLDEEEKDLNFFLDTETKIQMLERIKLLINIIILEVDSYPFSLKEYKDNEIKLYSKELLKGIKRICDFFNFERNLWNEPFILFYSLALKFLPKTKYFIYILNAKNIDMTFIRNKSIKIEKEIEDYMTSYDFNIYDRDEIYKLMVSAIFDILKETKITTLSFEKFLKNYEYIHEINFHPFSLINNTLYEDFYENKEEQDECENNIIKKIYEDSFININKTNYLVVFKSIVNNSKSNYRKIIIQYLISYINSKIKNDSFETFLCFITKTLFYDTNEMQKTCLLILNEQFFVYFNNILQKYIYHTFILSKNVYESKRFNSKVYNTKLILQFLQLLGEGFCTYFHDKIFLPLFHLENDENNIDKEINEYSIFENVIITLKQTIIYIFQTKKIVVELPSDRLIVLMTNLISFIIEYSVTLKEFSPILEEQINKLLFVEPKMIKILKLKYPENSIQRIKIVCLCKVQFLTLINTYLQNGKKFNTVKKLIEENFSPIEIFKEILYTFRLLIQTSFKIIPERMKILNSKKNVDSFINECINLYIKESKFRDSLELSVCNNLYILIKIFEMKYSKKEISSHFEKFEDNINSNNINLEKDKDIDWTIDSIYAFIIYNFLEQIILYVEVRTDKEIDPTEETLSKSDEIIMLQEHEEIDIIYYNEKNQLTFFQRPYLTFFLSNQTKNSFENNVDRDSATTKYMQLIYYSDYFLFEMIVNKHLNRGILNFLSQIDYVVFEWINYAFIISSNLDLVIQKYQSPSMNDEDYNNPSKIIKYKFKHKKVIISIIQIVYIILVLIIWFRFKFILYYEGNILKKYNITFVYRQKSDLGRNKSIPEAIINFFSSKSNITVYKLGKEMYKAIPLYERITIALFDTVLTNREICVLVYSAILLLLYLVFNKSLFIIIQVIFIANLIPTLFAIFSALMSKFKTMITVLFVIYLLTYLFMWIAYFFLAEDFSFLVYNTKTKKEEVENFCYSSIQCWMFITNYGVRNGGGVADQLPKDSYKINPKRYLVRFFFDLMFDILIVLIMLNVFFGIIVDAFAELRNKNYEREKDKSSVCFICQITSDECLRRNIDFGEHILKIHNLWNYVYFLTYLHLSNPNDFNRVEGYVWEKLGNQDYSWLPLES